MGRAITTLVIALSLVAMVRSSVAEPAVDQSITDELRANDAKARTISEFSADFTQQKTTPLLRKPLVSTGRVFAKGDRTLWRTEKPEPTQMLLDQSEIRVYYPDQKVVEIYPVAKQLSALAASPMPKLEVLEQYFTFGRMSAKEFDPPGDDAKHLAVRLTPTDSTLADHVEEVRVLLDRETGYLLRGENIDADGDRTVITFTNVQQGGVSEADVSLELPANTRESRPLEGLGDSPPPQQQQRRRSGQKQR